MMMMLMVLMMLMMLTMMMLMMILKTVGLGSWQQCEMTSLFLGTQVPVVEMCEMHLEMMAEEKMSFEKGRVGMHLVQKLGWKIQSLPNLHWDSFLYFPKVIATSS